MVSMDSILVHNGNAGTGKKASYNGGINTKLHQNINKRGEIETARNQAKSTNWKDKDGWYIYPDNTKNLDGLPGTYKTNTFKEGDILTRYVRKSNRPYDSTKDGGGYTAPEGFSFDARGLPGKESDYNVFKFQVVKPFDSTRSKVTPWFDKKGMGIHDKHKPIKELIDPKNSYIKMVE